MKKEIGSEFWDIETGNEDNRLFLKSTQWYISGRSALQAIILDLKNCHTVAMPSWCCDSMIKPFVDAGFEVLFYPVYWDETLKQEVCLDSDVLFLMDYFGYTDSKMDLVDYHGIVIRDVTHSLFSASYADANYYFGSLRKWSGVWTGGYVWASDGHSLSEVLTDEISYISLRKEAMNLKARYIDGKLTEKELANPKQYLELFSKAEEILDQIHIAPAAKRDIISATHLNAAHLKECRRTNAIILMQALHDYLIFSELGDKDCPMFVPVLVPGRKRDDLRKYLIQKEIYCPVHWPVSSYHRLDEREKVLYENELSLVCDQRYDMEDMHRIAEAVRSFLKGD